MAENPEESILSMKLLFVSILDRLKSSREEEVKEALTQYTKLVERFYSENEHLMAPAQYLAALEDVGYFAVLIELADRYHEQDNFT